MRVRGLRAKNPALLIAGQSPSHAVQTHRQRSTARASTWIRRCLSCGPSGIIFSSPALKFGCGMALCGACTVHIEGQAVRSCVTPISAAEGKRITTIEGLATPAGRAVQESWVQLDVPQCGYCQSGQIMSAAALLATNPCPQMRISTRRWPATSADVPRMCVFARRFTKRLHRCRLRRSRLEARSDHYVFSSRREFFCSVA